MAKLLTYGGHVIDPSISWPHFGHFKVNNLATARSIIWPPFLEPIKIGFFEIFCAQFSGGGAKLVFLKVVFDQKKRFLKNKNCAPFLGEFRLYLIVAA